MRPRFTGETLTERLGMSRLASRDISELIGVCKGVLADGVVNLHEAIFILEWLEMHPGVIDTWPASVLYEATDRMLEDGKLSHDQESELLGLLAEITGHPVRVDICSHLQRGVAAERRLSTPTTLPLCEPDAGLEFEGRNFVLTGNFFYGKRCDCESAVRGRGGNTQKGVSGKTDYLIVGEVGSEAWAHSSFGRKIEKAVYLRQEGHEIYIVHEPFWRACLEKK